MNSTEEPRPLADFGRNLRRLRVSRALTQERLSESIDLNIRTLQRIEAGQINILLSTLLRIQESLKCDWDELMPPK